MRQTIIAVALLAGACGTKTDDPPKAAAKPIVAAPAAPEPVKAEAPKPHAAPAEVVPAPPPPPSKVATDGPSDKDKELVRAANLVKTELQWTTPSGDKIRIAARKRLKGETFVVDIVVGTAIVETIDTGAEKPDETGFVHYEPRAGVVVVPDGVLVVAGATKVTGKADDSYDARLFVWDAAKKQLVVAKKIAFEDAYDPSKDS